MEKMIDLIRENIIKVIVVIILLSVAIWSLVANTPEILTIWNKASFICLECIGIG